MFQTVSFAPSLTPQTWTVPFYVYSIVANVAGAGGSGGWGPTNRQGGGGGGGARAIGTFSVSPGQSITIVSAKGGIAPTVANRDGNAGQASIVQVGSEILTANGGQGAQGSSGTAGGAGGIASATSGVLNTLLLNGQPGTDGFSYNTGIGGGGANGGAGGSGGYPFTPNSPATLSGLQGGGGAGSSGGGPPQIGPANGADGGVTFRYIISQQISIPSHTIKNHRSFCKHQSH